MTKTGDPALDGSGRYKGVKGEIRCSPVRFPPGPVPVFESGELHSSRYTS